MRLSVVGLIALLVFDIGIAVAAFDSVGTPSSTGIGLTSPPEVADETPPATDRMRVAVLGDLFAAGAGASSLETSWVRLLAEKRNWNVENLAEDRKGYASFIDSPCEIDTCSFKLGRRVRTAMKSVDLIVVSGGRSLIKLSDTSASAAVETFYRGLREAFPLADIVAVSPLWDSAQPPDSVARIAADIGASVAEVGGTFLDIGQPVVDEPEFVDQATGKPNNAGHAAIAKAVARAMNGSGFAA